MALKESFSWVPPGMKTLPRENLLKLVAKTEAETHHPGEPYPVRRFSAKELELAARSLIDRPVGRNHESVIPGAVVLDSEYSDKCVESVAYVPGDYAKKVRDGRIKNCSVEFTWRSEKLDESVSPHAIEFEGLVFTRVDLLEGLQPGDKNSKVMLFEAEKKTGSFISEVKMLQESIPGNVGKEVVVMVDAVVDTGEPSEPASPSSSTEPAAPAEPLPEESSTSYVERACSHYNITPEEYNANPEKYPLPPTGSEALNAALAENKSLKEAISRIQAELHTLKTSQYQRIADAKTFAHDELKSAVESVLPRGGLFKNPAGSLLISKIKEVLNESISTRS
jgi:hypothetical protein